MRSVGVVGFLCAVAVLGCGDDDGSGATGAGGSTGSTGTTSSSGSGGGPPFLDSYPLAAEFPEGGAYDATEHAFYVGGLGDGRVRRVDAATGAEEVLFEETAPGAWWTLGMHVDEAARRLWVCAMEDRRELGEDPQYDGYVWTFDLETGERERVVALADAAPEATCTDVTVDAAGDAYVVDRDFGDVYRLSADGAPEVFASSALLEGELAGQNGAVVLPDQSALLIIVYDPPRLVRVGLGDGAATDVTPPSDFEDPTTFSGADGLTHDGEVAYVVFTSTLVKVTPTSPDWSGTTAVSTTVSSGLTDVVATPGGLFLLNGQSLRFALGQDPDPFALTRFTGSIP